MKKTFKTFILYNCFIILVIFTQNLTVLSILMNNIHAFTKNMNITN